MGEKKGDSFYCFDFYLGSAVFLGICFILLSMKWYALVFLFTYICVWDWIFSFGQSSFVWLLLSLIFFYLFAYFSASIILFVPDEGLCPSSKICLLNACCTTKSKFSQMRLLDTVYRYSGDMKWDIHALLLFWSFLLYPRCMYTFRIVASLILVRS